MQQFNKTNELRKHRTCTKIQYMFDLTMEKRIRASIDQPPENKRENRDDLSREIGCGARARVRVRVSIQNFQGGFIAGGDCGGITAIEWRLGSKRDENLMYGEESVYV